MLLSDHIALPWAHRVDWAQLAIKWPQARRCRRPLLTGQNCMLCITVWPWPQAHAARLPTFLLGLPRDVVAAKREAIA